MQLPDLSRNDAVYLAPLGGLGEIGMNLMVVIYRKRAILVDCGLMFPDSGSLGIDIVVPDIRFLTESGIKIDGIVLTHGHEDHIGAVAYVIEDLGYPPVYGTPFTLALAEDRIREQGRLAKTKLISIRPPATFKVGDFKIKSLQVTHSVVDSMGLVIDTPVGTIIHSGDFKMDADPLDGKKIDQSGLMAAGKKGVLLLLSDSTNVEKEGWSKAEGEVGKGIYQLFKKIKKGKILIGVFASNIHRIQQILIAAKRVGRKVCFCGRSIETNIAIAKRLKYLEINDRDIISPDEIEKYNASEVVIIATGTQAEPRSALYRISLNDHHLIRLLPGDTVVFSSRFIPGNEKNISHLINNLYRRGAEVVDSDTANVHASGHAYQEEQKQLLKWTRPKFFLPAHGEYRMLVKHLRLAQETLPKVEGLVAENGDLLELTKNSFKKVGRVPFGKIYLDEGATDLHEELLRDRKQLANTGLVVVSIVLDKDEGKILEGPNFDIRGVNEVNLEQLQKGVVEKLADLSREARMDDIEVEEELRRFTRRFFRKENGVKPVVIPLIYKV
ncbi:MAG: metal-dependent hydrolase [Bacteriovoracaceae bacterium]|nr:metal-dependent hydrolase [Bacteriovoracaceae bacterium]